MSLRIIFAGTPDFAVPTLKKLLSSEHQVIAVYTQPDRPAGRGQQLQESPVKKIAVAKKIPVFQPKTLRDVAVQAELSSLQADIMVVVAYGLILPEAVLHMPRLGCVNLHPSLLPRWRGAAPIERALEAGDEVTGISIVQMDKSLDSGPILLQEKYPLVGVETSEKLHAVFSVRGAELMLKTIDAMSMHAIAQMVQDPAKVTQAPKIEKSESLIHWKESATKIFNKIRAFNDWPVASTIFKKENLKIWEASVIVEKSLAAPGTIIRLEEDGFCVATGEDVLQILSVQMPGKKRISAEDFLHAQSDHIIPGKTKLG